MIFHITRLVFSALLVSNVFFYFKNEVSGLIGIIVTCLGWASTKIIGDGFESLVFLATRDKQNK